MPVDWDALLPKLRAFLRTELGIDEAGVGPDTALVTTGLIDSVGLVRLATFLERASGVRIPDRDVHAEHFDSLRRLEAYLRWRAG